MQLLVNDNDGIEANRLSDYPRIGLPAISPPKPQATTSNEMCSKERCSHSLVANSSQDSVREQNKVAIGQKKKRKTKKSVSPFSFDIKYSVSAGSIGSVDSADEFSTESLGSARHRSQSSGVSQDGASSRGLYNNPRDSASLSDSTSLYTALPGSIQSILYREQPGLPQLDAHVRRESLKFLNVAAKLREERIIATPSGRIRDQIRVRKKNPSIEVHLAPIKEQPRVSSTTAQNLSQIRQALKRMEENRKPLKTFSGDEIEKAVLYVDSFGDGDGQISLEELELAFKRSRRAMATQAEEMRGRKLMKRLRYLLELLGMDIPTWFQTMATSCRHRENGVEVVSDGLISALELKQGLGRMASSLITNKQRRRRRKDGSINPYEFSTRDIVCLMRYMDPNGDGDLTLEEVEDAFERAKQPPEAVQIQSECGQVLKDLWEQMKVHNMRVVDLFSMLDVDGSGSINTCELEKGIRKLNEKPAQERALEERARQIELSSKMKQEKIEAQLKNARETVEQSIVDGSFQVIQILYSNIREKQMRLKDLFGASEIDKASSGSINGHMLFELMHKSNINCSEKEVLTLIKKLDTSGNGTIEVDELENAIKTQRHCIAILRKQGVSITDMLDSERSSCPLMPTMRERKSSNQSILSHNSNDSMGSYSSLSSQSVFKTGSQHLKDENLTIFKGMVEKNFPAINDKQTIRQTFSSTDSLSSALQTLSLHGQRGGAQLTESVSTDSLQNKNLLVTPISQALKKPKAAKQLLAVKLPPALAGTEMNSSWLTSWDSRMEKNVKRLGCV